MKTWLTALFGALVCHIVPAAAQCGTDPTSGTNMISTSVVVNSYYPGTGSPAAGTSSLTVGTLDARGSSNVIGMGDLVLIIQMQGADIDNSNTDTYGDGVSGGVASGYLSSNLVAGNYEFAAVLSVAGSTITFTNPLSNSYFTRAFASGALQTYQVIRVPRDFNLTINGSGTITCPAWNGSTGGVVVCDAANTLTLNGLITASALGFRGGGGEQFTGATAGNSNGSTTLLNTDYRFNSPVANASNKTGGAKGEGIVGTPAYVLPQSAVVCITNVVEGYINGSMGRGAPGNAGGGGTDGGPLAASSNQYNTGGGGGSNAGTGGQGGSGWHGSVGSQDVTTFPYGGYGGSVFSQASISRVIMGGGGGAGTANNSTAANQYQSSGGCGGGIVILRAALYAGTGTGSITADGGNAPGVVGVGGVTNTDAAGGAGAGGTIIAVTRTTITTGLSTISASAKGGAGGNMTNYYDHGPGGGGGGGYIISNGSFASTTLTGGANGLTRTGSTGGAINNAYGATAGANGQLITLPQAPSFVNLSSPGSPCGTLPVLLKSFSASIQDNTVQLNWEIAGAINFSGFEVEYSTDGASFGNIGDVPFNSSQSLYHFVHSPVTAPINYYRLKLIDSDGGYSYSEILIVRQTMSGQTFTVYPQPADDHVEINIVSQNAQLVDLQLFNALGEKVKDLRMQLNAGNNSFSLRGLRVLPAGMYVLSTSIDHNPIVTKVIINR